MASYNEIKYNLKMATGRRKRRMNKKTLIRNSQNNFISSFYIITLTLMTWSCTSWTDAEHQF